jgi:hypothetical protein
MEMAAEPMFTVHSSLFAACCLLFTALPACQGLEVSLFRVQPGTRDAAPRIALRPRAFQVPSDERLVLYSTECTVVECRITVWKSAAAPHGDSGTR